MSIPNDPRNDYAQPQQAFPADGPQADGSHPSWPGTPAPGHLGTHRPQRIETKPSYRTTEFWVYLAAVVAVLIASRVVGSTEHHPDRFGAERAWFFVVLLTMAYLGSRGLAKAGANAPAESERPAYQDPAIRAANRR